MELSDHSGSLDALFCGYKDFLMLLAAVLTSDHRLSFFLFAFCVFLPPHFLQVFRPLELYILDL